MNRILAAAFAPSRRGPARLVTFFAAAVAMHGILFGLAAAIKSAFPGLFDGFELIGQALFWVLGVPALLLTSPFISILWQLGLMNAPGWFAWPKPLGFALAYAIWIAVLVAIALALQRWSPSSPPQENPERHPPPDR